MLSMNIIEKEQKISLPNQSQVKEFVRVKVKGSASRFQFRQTLDRKSMRESKDYSVAIDNLFKSYKANNVGALAWLNQVSADNFEINDIPIFNVENKSDIRSSMISSPTTPNPRRRPNKRSTRRAERAEENTGRVIDI